MSTVIEEKTLIVRLHGTEKKTFVLTETSVLTETFLIDAIAGIHGQGLLITLLWTKVVGGHVRDHEAPLGGIPIVDCQRKEISSTMEGTETRGDA
jgi:hypothetical protein